MDRSILVNKDNKIKKNYFKNVTLIKVLDVENNEIEIEEETYNAYLKLKDSLIEDNLEIGITSAYRSPEEQEKIYNKYLKVYGEEYANKYVAPKGYSEHHTGLAIDITIKEDGKYIMNEQELLTLEEQFHIIHERLYKFGFILRYPTNKEKETKYPYEPWHIRYIGKFISNIIAKNNLSLEEYKTKYSGVIVLNKKKGYTSFDVVKKISNLFGIKKIGHTGTLDPLAEGVLIICIGNATKIEELITAEDKEYIAKVRTGIKTDTYDIEGNIIETKEVDEIPKLEEVIKSFKKTYLQEVPIFSAVKVNGKKLYEYARNNIKVELPKKEVTIKEIELLENHNKDFRFRTVVSKGCYIRSLINDISKELDIPMTMTELTRTKQGTVSIEESFTIEDIENNNYKIYSIEEIVNFKTVTLKEKEAFKVSNGVPIDNNWNIKDKVLFKDENDKLLGIYQNIGDKLVVWKNFNN